MAQFEGVDGKCFKSSSIKLEVLSVSPECVWSTAAMLGGERRAGQDCAKYQGQAQAATTGGSCKLHHRSAQGWATRAMRKIGELTEETSHNIRPAQLRVSNCSL